MRRIYLAFIFLILCTFAFPLFDFNYAGQNFEPNEDEGNLEPNYPHQGTGQKIYLPPAEKIYKDEHGQYFYFGAKRKRLDMGGSGGFFIESLGLNSSQKNDLLAQIAFSGGITGNMAESFPLFGGGGYWHANKNFYLGCRGAGGVMTVGTGSNRLKYSIGYGGMDFLVLIPFGGEDFNVVLGCLVGAGGLEMDSKGTAKYRKTFWLLEPKAGLQINVTKFFAIRALASYLYSQDINSEVEGALANVGFDEDMSLRNYTLGLSFEWGLF